MAAAADESTDGWHSRGYFPHFDGEGVTQHVCFHLFDSLPQPVLARWRDELKARPPKEADLEWRRRVQAFLDSGYGHSLFTPKSEFKMSEILHSWKSFTAHECNKLLSRTGQFWAREPFDRYIRNQRHFDNSLAYIENNPVHAGLCKKSEDWKWSSARKRQSTQTPDVVNAMM